MGVPIDVAPAVRVRVGERALFHVAVVQATRNPLGHSTPSVVNVLRTVAIVPICEIRVPHADGVTPFMDRHLLKVQVRERSMPGVFVDVPAKRGVEMDLERKNVLVVRVGDPTVHAGDSHISVPVNMLGRVAVVYPGVAWEDLDLVFSTALGGVVSPNMFTRWTKKLSVEAGVRALTPHPAGRHTWATLALSSGKIHPKVVQERLGHSSISITLDRYSHVVEGMDREAAEIVARMIKGSG